MPGETFDVAIIGGGIVGLATAMSLAADAKVVVIETERDVALHQTGHNSGVIHSGLYYKPGSLKARNCVVGRELMYQFCAEQSIPHERCGKLVVATSDAELPALAELERRGRENGLDGIRRLQAQDISEYEPHTRGVAALFVPQTGIVDYRAVAARYAELVSAAGSDFRANHRFTRLRQDGPELVLETTAGAIRARQLIGCAGLQSDRVARLCGVEPGMHVVPFRGEYYDLVPARASLVRNLIYPVPDPRFPFLGVHFTRRITGGVEAGPNAVLALRREGYGRLSFSARDSWQLLRSLSFWRMASRHWRTGCGELYRSWSKQAFVAALRRLIPDLQPSDLHPAGCGVRAQALGRDGALVDDFSIVEAPRMIHVLNAPSPAATASISIGQTIADIARRNFALASARN